MITLMSETFAGRKFWGSVQPQNFNISWETTFTDNLFSIYLQEKTFAVDSIKNILQENTLVGKNVKTKFLVKSQVFFSFFYFCQLLRYQGHFFALVKFLC